MWFCITDLSNSSIWLFVSWKWVFLLFQYRRGFELSRLLLFVDVASVFECSVYVRHFPFNFLLKSYATHSHSLHLQELQTCTFTINTILFCVGCFCLHVRNYIYIYNLKKLLSSKHMITLHYFLHFTLQTAYPKPEIEL